jgi:trans-aconitate 2-methyltransferase
MSDWNPNKYLKFKDERTQPVHDLLSRIEIEDPKLILDLGCGPGNSTAALAKRWPSSEIMGLDSSKSMVEQAINDHPEIKFIVGDACKDLSNLGHFDLIFANASLQWMPDHEVLIPHLYSMLNSKGVFAAQIPQFDRMPVSGIITDVERSDEWAGFFEDFKPGFHFKPVGFYYDVLSKLANHIHIWVTDYYHMMPTHMAIMEMIESTGLRPYLDRLPPQGIPSFKNTILERIKIEYPNQIDGSVLFPFKRLFIVSY